MRDVALHRCSPVLFAIIAVYFLAAFDTAHGGDHPLAIGGTLGVAFPFGDIRDNPAATFSPSEEGLSGSLNAEVHVYRKLSVVAGYNYCKFAGQDQEKKRVSFLEAGVQFTNQNPGRAWMPFFAMAIGAGKLGTKYEDIHAGEAVIDFTGDTDWHFGAKAAIGARRHIARNMLLRLAAEFRMIDIEGHTVTYVERVTLGTDSSEQKTTDLIVGDVTMFNVGIGLYFLP